MNHKIKWACLLCFLLAILTLGQSFSMYASTHYSNEFDLNVNARVYDLRFNPNGGVFSDNTSSVKAMPSQTGNPLFTTAAIPGSADVSLLGNTLLGWSHKDSGTFYDRDTDIIVPSVNTTLDAVWGENRRDIDSNIITGDSRTAKIAYLPTMQFNGAFTENKTAIVEALLNIDADILALPLVDRNTNTDGIIGNYNTGVDVYAELAEAMKEAYPYSDFFGAWDIVKSYDPAKSGDMGYIGHMVLSKYQLVDRGCQNTQDAALASDGGDIEGRGYLYVKAAIDSYTTLGVFITHAGPNYDQEWRNFGGENGLFKTKLNSDNQDDYWVILGNTKLNGDPSKVNTYLGVTGTVSTNAGSDNSIFLSDGLIYDNAGTLDTLEQYTDRLVTYADVVVPSKATAQLSNVVLNWWANGFGQDAAEFADIKRAVKDSNADVVTLLQTSLMKQGVMDVRTLAEEMGYPYFAYTVADGDVGDGTDRTHIVLSRFPLTERGDIRLVDWTNATEEGRAFGHVIVNWSGIDVDLFYGVSDNSSNQAATLESTIAQRMQKGDSPHPFIVSSRDVAGIEGITKYANTDVHSYSDGDCNFVAASGWFDKADPFHNAVSWSGWDGVSSQDYFHVSIHDPLGTSTGSNFAVANGPDGTVYIEYTTLSNTNDRIFIPLSQLDDLSQGTEYTISFDYTASGTCDDCRLYGWRIVNQATADKYSGTNTSLLTLDGEDKTAEYMEEFCTSNGAFNLSGTQTASFTAGPDAAGEPLYLYIEYSGVADGTTLWQSLKNITVTPKA